MVSSEIGQRDSPEETTPLLRDNQDQNSNGQDGDEEEGEGGADENLLVRDPSTKFILAVNGAVWIGVFFAALDTTVVATLTGPISSSFESLGLLSWLATGYLIANSACQPLSGKLTDVFGRRAGLMVSNFFFGLGTLICGLAPNAGAMIAGRVIAGVGGGGLTCIATFLQSDLVPLRTRGLWQGFGNLVFGMGMGLGGVFGGICADRLSWRWAFLIQVPFIVVSAVMVWFLLDLPVRGLPGNDDNVDDDESHQVREDGNREGAETEEERKSRKRRSALSRIDFLGAGLLVVGLVLLLLGLNTGGNQLPWKHPLVVTSLVLAAVTMAAFLYVESTPSIVKEPVIPVSLVIRTRTVLAACMANWFSTMSAFLALYYVPIYLQFILRTSATAAGLRVIPFAIGTSTGSLISGLTMRKTGHYYTLNLFFMLQFILGAALLCTFNISSPSWTTYLYVTPMGLGYGSMLTITLVGMISAVPHEFQAVITAASYAFRSTGSTIGITIASAVFQNVLTKELESRYGGLEGSQEIIKRLRESLDEIDRLPSGWDVGVVRGIYMDALRGAFFSGLGLAVLAGLMGLGMKEHVLHKNLARR